MRPRVSGSGRFQTPAGSRANGPVPTVSATRLGDVGARLGPAAGAHFRRAAGEAGTRQRPRPGVGTALRSLGAFGELRLDDDRLVGPEDLFLALAGEQPDELVPLDRLPLEQDLRGRLEA